MSAASLPDPPLGDAAFHLHAFEDVAPWSLLRIEGRAQLDSRRLSLHYRLSGDLAAVRIPAPESSPERRDGLWQTTCLEFFVAVAGEEPYWEVNLSPAGHWNVYRLDGYRSGLRPEPAFAALPFNVSRTEDALELSVDCDLTPIVGPDQPLELAISVVVERVDGAIGYWALAHPGPEPDFHRRDAFRPLPRRSAAEHPFPG